MSNPDAEYWKTRYDRQCGDLKFQTDKADEVVRLNGQLEAQRDSIKAERDSLERSLQACGKFREGQMKDNERLLMALEEARLLLIEARQWERKGYPVMRERIDQWTIKHADDGQFRP